MNGQEHLEAGRELDLLIAEKIMGWKRLGRVPKQTFLQADHVYRNEHGQYVEPESIPSFSGDIAAAWRVVEHMRENGYTLNLFVHANDEDENVHRTAVATFIYDHRPKMIRGRSFKYRSPSAALAICVAALRARSERETKPS